MAKDTTRLIEVYGRALEQGGSDKLALRIACFVKKWLQDKGLPHDERDDTWYASWLAQYDQRLKWGPIALIMTTESRYLLDELNAERDGEWLDFGQSIGFHIDRPDYTSWSFYPIDDHFAARVRAAIEFEWLARLVAPDFSRIYSEVYNYFSIAPEQMGKLHHRAFEEFLASIFLEQGYRTILGPGSGDEGVDLRLLENSVHGESLTVVQAKRYKKPIDLQWVASLSGVVHDQDADRGLFVTTSRYLPSAQKFAARQKRSIELADSTDVAAWCNSIASLKSSEDWLRQAARNYKFDPERVVCATDYGPMIVSKFGCIVAETPNAVRIALLESDEHYFDHPTRGWVTPRTPLDISTTRTVTARVTPSKFGTPGSVTYWSDDGDLFVPWDKNPVWYDLND